MIFSFESLVLSELINHIAIDEILSDLKLNRRGNMLGLLLVNELSKRVIEPEDLTNDELRLLSINVSNIWDFDNFDYLFEMKFDETPHITPNFQNSKPSGGSATDEELASALWRLRDQILESTVGISTEYLGPL